MPSAFVAVDCSVEFVDDKFEVVAVTVVAVAKWLSVVVAVVFD